MTVWASKTSAAGKLRRAMNRIFSKSALVLAALVVCLFVVAGCGSKSSSDSDPTRAIQDALEKTSTITSGQAKLDGALSIGSLPGSISISGGGPFDTKADGGPAFKLELSVELAGTPQKIGFAAVDGKNYLLVGDKAVEQKAGKGGSLDSGQIANFIKGLGEFTSDAKKTGENTYTAKVDIKAMLEDFSKKSDGSLKNLSIPGLGSADQLTKSIGDADVTVSVDDEGYASEIDLNLSITNNGSQGGLRLKIDLDEINQPQTIEAPTDVVSSASALGALGAAAAAAGE